MRRSIYATPLALLLVGCASPPRGPVLASSANNPVYAIGYADALTSSTTAIADAEQQEKALASGFTARLGDLKRLDWDKVLTVVNESDLAGKSADFVDGHRDSDAVRGFWTDEKGPITTKVAGNAQYTVKQASCTNADVGGAVTSTLNDAMDKEPRKWLRARNGAALVLERYKSSFGPQNVTALEKLADDVSQASYLVHVVLIEQRERLRAMLVDKNDVKATLDRFVEDEKAAEADPGSSAADKKASEERIAAAGRAKANVDTAAAQAEQTLKDIDAAVNAATKDYDTALAALKEEIQKRKAAEPAGKTARQ